MTSAYAAARDGLRLSESAGHVRFFLLGVAKAGSTALYEILGQHSQVFVCPIKDPGFFAAADLLAIEAPNIHSAILRNAAAVERWIDNDVTNLPDHGFAFEWNSYQGLFRGLRDELAVGEGSTIYWNAPEAPGAIRERFPDARFIVVLRNPAERFFSQYLATRWGHPRRSCRECFTLALERHDEPGPIFDVGLYATNLRRFFRHFPRSQFSIHLYEDFCSEPATVCREIFAFLGVDPEFPVDVSVRVNEPLLPRSPTLQALRLSLAGSRSLSGFVPAPLRDILRRSLRKPRSRETMDPADRRAIIDHYRDEILQTSELIGRDLSAWLE